MLNISLSTEDNTVVITCFYFITTHRCSVVMFLVTSVC